MRIVLLLVVFNVTWFLFFRCTVLHSGNVSTGVMPDCPWSHTVYGKSKIAYFLGFSLSNHAALIAEAKQDLYLRNKLSEKQKLSNFTVDRIFSHYIIFSKLTVVVSADVYDCRDSSRLSIISQDPSINSNFSPLKTNMGLS